MKQRWGLIVLVAVISFFSGGLLLQSARARTTSVAGPELLGQHAIVVVFFESGIRIVQLFGQAGCGQMVDAVGRE